MDSGHKLTRDPPSTTLIQPTKRHCLKDKVAKKCIDLLTFFPKKIVSLQRGLKKPKKEKFKAA